MALRVKRREEVFGGKCANAVTIVNCFHHDRLSSTVYNCFPQDESIGRSIILCNVLNLYIGPVTEGLRGLAEENYLLTKKQHRGIAITAKRVRSLSTSEK